MEHHYTLCYNEYEGNDNVISDQWYISIYHVLFENAQKIAIILK
jgi:hypothetical protein